MPKKRGPTHADLLLWDQLQELPLGIKKKELQFIPSRKWRFDFAILPQEPPILLTRGVAIEIEGAVWTQGRHTRGKGFIADMEKYNHAALLGWRVLRFTPQQVLDGTAIAFIKQVLESEQGCDRAFFGRKVAMNSPAHDKAIEKAREIASCRQVDYYQCIVGRHPSECPAHLQEAIADALLPYLEREDELRKLAEEMKEDGPDRSRDYPVEILAILDKGKP